MGDETSQRPWRLMGEHIEEYGGNVVVRCKGMDADAALIVTAVNAHDDLVSALEDTLSALDEYLRDNGAPDGPVETRARSLLEKVKHGR